MNLLRKLLFAGLILLPSIPWLHAQPVITSQPTSQTNLPGTTVSFSVAVSGAGPFTYQWQLNGSYLPNNTITTVAGSGGGAVGDGGAATNGSLFNPSGVAFDAPGNLYIADYFHNRIRMVDSNGIITTVAGNGTQAFTGDGGAATSASLSNPSGVAVDATGNLYIADYATNRIRKVTNGIITTVAGNGTATFAGDGAAATSASLSSPYGVALDAIGNLYIADSTNNRVRKVTNGIITTVAGNGTQAFAGDGSAATSASLSNPSGVALDAIGNLYIADCTNNRVRKVATNGIITTVAGNGTAAFAGDGGAATGASLSNPSGVALDGLGNLYIADNNNNRIRKVATNGIITTVAGNGTAAFAGDGGAATNASLSNPSGVALDGLGDLYIADKLNGRIRKVLLDDTYPTLTLRNIGAVNAGSYKVVITGSSGSVTSSVAVLTVQAPPAITVQPTNQVVALGTTASLSVTAAGSGTLDYDWYVAGTNLLQSGAVSTLTLPNVSLNNSGNYTVVVTNNYGSITSQVAVLSVLTLPSLSLGHTVFSDAFSASSVNSNTPAPPTPTSTSYEIVSSKTWNPTPTNAAGSMAFGLGATSSGIIEAQARFSPTGVTLINPGDFVQMSVTFTNTSGILSQSGTWGFGLYNSGGVTPIAGGMNATLSTNSTLGIGAAQNWQGYVAQIGFTGGNSGFFDRQSQAGNTNNNQDLVTSGTSASYRNPGGAVIGSVSTTPSTTLTVGSRYTEVLTYTMTSAGGLQLQSQLYTGTGTGGTLLSSMIATTPAPPLTSVFDSLAFGWRATGNVGSTMNVRSVTVTGYTSPATLASSVSGPTLTLSWPTNFLGWLVQSNAASLTTPANWSTIPGSGGTTNFLITINPRKTNIFYRLVSP